jgi:hypothetical protein
MKQKLLQMFALACALVLNATAWAQHPTLAMDAFEIEPGGTKEVTLKLEQDGLRIKAFQCQFNLPAGLTMAKPKAEKTMWNEEDEENVKPTVNFNEENNAIAVWTAQGLLFNTDATDVLKITFTADAAFQGGTISITGISVSDENNNGYDTEKVDVVVTTPGGGVTPATGFGLFMELPNNEKRIQQGSTVTATLYLNPGEKVIKAFQCQFELPSWLSMAKPKAEKTMWNEEDEENVKPTVNFNEENNAIAVWTAEGLLFNNDLIDANGSIKVLKIDFTAETFVDDDADETNNGVYNRYNDKIKIKGISLSDKDNNGIDLDDVEIPVFYKVGISDMEDDAPATSEAYTISGVRVNKMTRGLYIVNGKKVVVK